jgi:hypothetical protein
MALSADSRQLALGRADGTIWICAGSQWLDKLFERFSTGEAPPLPQLWEQLGASDPMLAYAAIGRMSQQPRAAVALLREKLPALQAEPLPAKEIDSLIGQLSSDKPAIRREASFRLLASKPAVDSAIRAALAGNLRREVRVRLEVLLAAQVSPSDTSLRLCRAVQTLERIATPAARELLRSLSAGPAQSELTCEAQRASRRLDAVVPSATNANR